MRSLFSTEGSFGNGNPTSTRSKEALKSEGFGKTTQRHPCAKSGPRQSLVQFFRRAQPKGPCRTDFSTGTDLIRRTEFRPRTDSVRRLRRCVRIVSAVRRGILRTHCLASPYCFQKSAVLFLGWWVLAGCWAGGSCAREMPNFLRERVTSELYRE